MRRTLLPVPLVALLMAITGAPSPLHAQPGGVVKDIFGSEKCPVSNGEEIVVCRRFPESERYRIPKDLRDAAKDAPAPTWANRAMALEYVGRSGTSSCSPSGGGGDWTGCWTRLMNQAKAERKDEKKAEQDIPLPR